METNSRVYLLREYPLFSSMNRRKSDKWSQSFINLIQEKPSV